MSPLQIDILLHYYCRATDYPDLTPPAQKEAISYFIEHGYLEYTSTEKEAVRYKPTDKLHVYCEALCNVPEPKQIWVVGS